MIKGKFEEAMCGDFIEWEKGQSKLAQNEIKELWEAEELF